MQSSACAMIHSEEFLHSSRKEFLLHHLIRREISQEVSIV